MTLDGAKKVIATAEAEAKQLGAPGGAIAVVDDAGNLLALGRLDGTFAASANISIGKARTAALFKKPTKFFEEIINMGRTTMVTLPDFTPLQGGVLVRGRWRYSDAKIIEVDHRAIGPDFKPSGLPNRTHDTEPKAGAADFDDSQWEAIDPPRPEHRRSTGKLCFGWVRVKITIPGGSENSIPLARPSCSSASWTITPKCG